jgi:hypothetical protein
MGKWPTAHELLGVFHDGLEEALEGQLQVVVQVVLEVNGQVVLQRVDGILCLVIRLYPLGCLRTPASQAWNLPRRQRLTHTAACCWAFAHYWEAQGHCVFDCLIIRGVSGGGATLMIT